MALDGYPLAERRTVEQISTEAFLRGCRDKDAAKAAMEKEPKSIHKALKYVKASIANHRAIFGGKYYPHRQVTFSDEADIIEDEDEHDVRFVKNGYDSHRVTRRLQTEVNELKSMMSEIATILKDKNSGDQNSTRLRSRSPTPSRRPYQNGNLANITCFKCQRKGHMERDCPGSALREGEDKIPSPVSNLTGSKSLN